MHPLLTLIAPHSAFQILKRCFLQNGVRGEQRRGGDSAITQGPLRPWLFVLPLISAGMCQEPRGNQFPCKGAGRSTFPNSFILIIEQNPDNEPIYVAYLPLSDFTHTSILARLLLIFVVAKEAVPFVLICYEYCLLKCETMTCCDNLIQERFSCLVVCIHATS